MEKPANCKDRRGGIQRASCQRELTLLRRIDGKDNATHVGERWTNVHMVGERERRKEGGTGGSSRDR